MTGSIRASRIACWPPGKLAGAAATARAEQLAGWYLTQLAANGMSVEAPGEALKAELAEIGAQMAAEWAETAGDAGQAAIDAYKMAE